mgnify:CR=1 FL=1
MSRPAGGTPPPLGPRRRSVLAAVGVALASMTPGCDKLRGSSSGARIDAAWHRHALLDGLLARWVAVAPSETGAMRSAVDRRWVAAAEQPGDLTEHARLVYAFAIGYELSQDKRYLDAADRGAEFLLAHFHDPLHGGFFTRVAADGRVIHPSKSAYGHAFALFALSHMARVTQQERYRSAALRTWQVIHTWLRNPSGGFFGDLPRDFAKPAQPQGGSQNPVMHMFEALLALHDATQDPAALDGAKGVAEFVVYKLLVGLPDGGAYIPEWFDPAWQPLPTRDAGGYTDIGHQFEWSHMLRAAEQRGLVGVYAQTAERLLQFATRVGYDEIDGGAFTAMYPDGTVNRDKHFWQQCEALRAFLAAAAAGGQPEMRRRYEQTLALVREQFIDQTHGGWFAKACKRGDCAGAQPEPYHMTGMHAMALAMAAEAAR